MVANHAALCLTYVGNGRAFSYRIIKLKRKSVGADADEELFLICQPTLMGWSSDRYNIMLPDETGDV